MKKIDDKYFNNPEQYIPVGTYCYNSDGRCPFWDKDKSKMPQENGYCHYLKQGDWDNEGFGLLWDQVKECGIKDYNTWCLDCKYMTDLNGYMARCTKHNKEVDVETGCNDFEPKK